MELRVGLSEEEKWRVKWVVQWTQRMAAKYGGIVYEDNGNRWDWGQALCRECYGPNWNAGMNQFDVCVPSMEDIGRAQRWENGEIPDWVDQKKTRRKP